MIMTGLTLTSANRLQSNNVCTTFTRCSDQVICTSWTTQEPSTSSIRAVTEGMGFHEFVVIDRTRRSVHVVVASDD